MMIAKLAYYETKYAFWSVVANMLDDLFLTSMIAIVGTIIYLKI